MDITMKCPVCDAEWPTDSVKIAFEKKPKRLTPKHFVLFFPCSHNSTLATMKRAKLISSRDAKIILEFSQREHDLRQFSS